MKQMLTRLIFASSIALFWFFIAGKSGILHYPILSFCAIGAISIFAIFANIEPKKYCNPFKLINYIFWLFREILTSSWHVTKIIWNPYLKIKPRIIEVQADFNPSSPEIVVFANSITLTPGTYTVDIEGNKLMVHALTTGNIRDLTSGDMQKRIQNLFN